MTVAIPVAEGRVLDLPTGAAIICALGLLLVVAQSAGALRYRRVSTQTIARIQASAPNTAQNAAAVRYHDK